MLCHSRAFWDVSTSRKYQATAVGSLINHLTSFARKRLQNRMKSPILSLQKPDTGLRVLCYHFKISHKLNNNTKAKNKTDDQKHYFSLCGFAISRRRLLFPSPSFVIVGHPQSRRLVLIFSHVFPSHSVCTNIIGEAKE